MYNRIENARIVQGGASNERKVAQVLVDAIDECRAQGVNARDDDAVFLILHQLAFLVTGHDLAVGDDRLAERWRRAADRLGC